MELNLELREVETLLTKHNLQDTVWGKRIIQATKPTWVEEEERHMKGFTFQDVLNAETWVTCACGEVTVDIPRGNKSNKDIPQDEGLVRLGDTFATAVRRENRLLAAKTLIKIEERALEVSKEHRLRGKACDAN